LSVTTVKKHLSLILDFVKALQWSIDFVVLTLLGCSEKALDYTRLSLGGGMNIFPFSLLPSIGGLYQLVYRPPPIGDQGYIAQGCVPIVYDQFSFAKEMCRACHAFSRE